MDTQMLQTLTEISSNLTVVTLLIIGIYRLNVTLKEVEKSRDEWIERHVRHLERFHPHALPDTQETN